jgi:autotransporter-associated beta strand protein
MRLSASNTFSGPVTVNSGVLRYNHSSGLTNTTVVAVNNGGTLDMNGITDTFASLSSTAGHTTGAVLQGGVALTLAATSGTTSYDGTITGSGTFNKTGASTQILNGNNTLGAVSLTGGKLLFNGTNTTGGISVSNATLGGTGSVSGPVAINSNGRLAPGASLESFNVGALTLNTGGHLDFEVGAGGIADVVNVGGLLNMAGTTSVHLTDTGGMDAGIYTLIDYGTRTGSVASLGTPTGGPTNFDYKLADTGSTIDLLVMLPGDFNLDWTVDAGDYLTWRAGGAAYTMADYDKWRLNYGRTANPGSGASLDTSGAVPEPSSIALLLSMLATVVCLRRRSRS